jgi:hypothetical protein
LIIAIKQHVGIKENAHLLVNVFSAQIGKAWILIGLIRWKQLPLAMPFFNKLHYRTFVIVLARIVIRGLRSGLMNRDMKFATSNIAFEVLSILYRESGQDGSRVF